MSDNEDADVDINLLSELLALAENDDNDSAPAHVKEPTKVENFGSVLEDLDRIPIKSSSRSKLADKTSHFNNNTESKSKKSAIHNGDTDSSDDEDARKYGGATDGFGSNVKRMLKTAEEEKRSGPRLSDFKDFNTRMPSWKSPASSGASSKSSLCLPAKNKTGPMDVYTDSSIGMRIINPVVSSTVIKERLVGRKVISMNQAKQFTSEGKITDDWVIFGAIVYKAPPKTSAKGNTYSIIKLSDLRGPGNPKTVSLFLFSSAFKNHGKDSLGTVLGILNPGVMDNSRSHGDEACLSVDNSDRVMVLGTSKDFGFCKSKKKNGENCTSVVNLALCEYCVYHVKQEYQKCSRRSDIQSSFNGPGLANLRNKVLGKNEVFYGGQSFSAVPARKSKKLTEKDQSRLMALSGLATISPSLKGKASGRSGLATSVDIGHRQTQKDMDRLRKLILEDNNKLPAPSTKSVVTAQFKPGEVQPDEAKQAALALIAKKKLSEERSELQRQEDGCVPEDTLKLPSSSVMKDAAVMNESVSVSRGVMATLALNKKKSNSGMTASSLGLGRSVPVEVPSTTSKETDTTPSSKQSKVEGKIVQAETSPMVTNRSKTKINKKPDKVETSPALSSIQLQKLASNGVDFESRMLKQAAQKAVLQEEAAKVNINATPSMLGLGRSSSSLPVLGKGLSSSATIDLDAPFSKKISASAKLNAINLIKKRGGISKLDPNNREFESRKKTPKETKSVKRPRDETVTPTDILKKFKRSLPEQDKEKEKELTKARFKELMETKSRHTDLIEAAEDEAQEKYFGKLEKKEQMEEKMLNTFKVACKAVRCLTCKYTSFSASERCKTERHPLKVMDATKRFFKCADCGNRTVSLDLIPLVSCSNCSSSRWERTAMIKERKVGVTQEVLSVRGMEETFIGSVTTGANINLLVPEDGA